ncbi:MAG TPA: hypothetical protein VHV26_00775 [Rhizomicrobium sp.]|jgi:hypothetical protein|nr:hypothetical protein [Rhizomicrobium sp.]
MDQGPPLTHVYNLARLGHAGERVRLVAGPEERAAIARWSGVSSVEGLSADIDLKKVSPSKFTLEIALTADLAQACVVTWEPVPAHIERHFRRELHFGGPVRRKVESVVPQTVALTGLEEEEPPEEIESLQYDLARPVLEEYVLSLEPYPRAEGAEFGLEPATEDRPESPFAALKTLKPKF